MNDDVLLIVINMRSFEYTVQKRIRIFLNLIKTMENSWPNIKRRSKLMCGCGWTIRLYVGKKAHFFHGVWVTVN